MGHFWEPCRNNLSETGQELTFDITQKKFPYHSILTHGEICGITDDFDHGECTRSISRVLFHLSVTKLIYSSIVLPVFTFFLNLFRLKITDYHSISKLHLDPEDHRHFNSIFTICHI